MDLLNETFLLKTKNTLFNLLIRETSQFLCYERLLNLTYVTYKNEIFCKMQFWSHCYTVVSYQALFRLSVYKIPTVYISGAKNMSFCTIGDFGSPTIVCRQVQTCCYTRFFVRKIGYINFVPKSVRRPSVRLSVRPCVCLSVRPSRFL